MIVQSYPSKNPIKQQSSVVTYGNPFVNTKPPQQMGPYLTPKEVLQATKLKITSAEFHRRDTILRDIYRKCTFKRGDLLIPKTEAGREKYGQCKVTSIVDCYLNYGLEEWPKNDNPLIVHFVSELNGNAFATVNYFEEAIKQC